MEGQRSAGDRLHTWCPSSGQVESPLRTGNPRPSTLPTGSGQEIPFFPTLGIQKLEWVDGWPTVDQAIDLPEVTGAPEPESAVVGKKASFTARASGTPAPVAVWERQWTTAPPGFRSRNSR